MSDPVKVEALVQAECVATGEVVRKSKRGGSSGKNKKVIPKPSGTYDISRAVQRATSAPSPLENDDGSEGLRCAAVHHWRARMMVKLSSLYSDAAWDAQEKPRKFFIKHRGFGPSHGRGDLPAHRRMFLRCAMASVERAYELAPSSSECATLRACILSLVNNEEGTAVKDAALSRACAACRHAVQLHERWTDEASRDDFEVDILHSPGAAAASAPSDGGGINTAVGSAPVGASGSRARRIESLRSMAVYAAHMLADRRGGWDFETYWVRDTGDVGLAGSSSGDEVDATAAKVVAFVLESSEDEEDVDGEEGGEWDMWQSPSILDYSLAALRGQP